MWHVVRAKTDDEEMVRNVTYKVHASVHASAQPSPAQTLRTLRRDPEASGVAGHGTFYICSGH